MITPTAIATTKTVMTNAHGVFGELASAVMPEIEERARFYHVGSFRAHTREEGWGPGRRR